MASQFDAAAAEFRELARSAGADRRGRADRAHRQAHPAGCFVGSGKADEAKLLVQAGRRRPGAGQPPLSPVQERNLEKLLECRVVDRTGLILDIFAQRARSHEGKLQVELAQLQHMATRLVRGWTHLERQRGGAIGLRGPGETQLETDRRLLASGSSMLQKRLEKVEVQRTQDARRASAASCRGRPGRLHQCRQVDPVQRADRRRMSTPPTSCSPPWTRPCAAIGAAQAGRSSGRYRRLRPRSAARTRRCVPLHADRSARGGPVAARHRRRRPAARRTHRAGRRVLAEIGAGEIPQIAGVQQDRPHRVRVRLAPDLTMQPACCCRAIGVAAGRIPPATTHSGRNGWSSAANATLQDWINGLE
jgi:hypothetical protein